MTDDSTAPRSSDFDAKALGAPSTVAPSATARELRLATLDRVAAFSLLALALVCWVIALLGLASLVMGQVVHPDAVLIPFVAGLLLGGLALPFLLAAYAMRHGATRRWGAQWTACIVPVVLALIIWLSV